MRHVRAGSDEHHGETAYIPRADIHVWKARLEDDGPAWSRAFALENAAWFMSFCESPVMIFTDFVDIEMLFFWLCKTRDSTLEGMRSIERCHLMHDPHKLLRAITPKRPAVHEGDFHSYLKGERWQSFAQGQHATANNHTSVRLSCLCPRETHKK